MAHRPLRGRRHEPIPDRSLTCDPAHGNPAMRGAAATDGIDTVASRHGFDDGSPPQPVRWNGAPMAGPLAAHGRSLSAQAQRHH